MTYADFMDRSAPPPARRRRDRAATRTALLDAARRRFSRQGYDGTGIREIASDAGVDAALIFRYFGSKRKLYAEAMRVEIPAGLTADPRRPVVHVTDVMLRDIVFADLREDGEHPLLGMLRSAGNADAREELRVQLCENYLKDLAGRIEGEDAGLRAELVGALLLGMGVMRSVVGSPVLKDAPYERVRGLVARLVGLLASGAAAPQTGGDPGDGVPGR
ncbi:DNA-binding transcriptional regulator, AcrR family [Thermostaphylospora chromogena]|uniref:DNA-binding transcriptional regulator, AcrR family n=2 Tax=Thermostaphylospora chromogena TaxID=35622 RepID=A0A1H1BHX0_9ACTN|nr:DNA-binding transcriptional regulator, AcrR family [Thermostaphylospora chromogena]